MNRKELNKTFMMTSNWNKPFGPQGLKKISALRVKVIEVIVVNESVKVPA